MGVISLVSTHRQAMRDDVEIFLLLLKAVLSLPIRYKFI
jgi:hypothetical protein